jgi:hypothetical protein
MNAYIATQSGGNIAPYGMRPAQEFVDGTWQFVLPTIIAFATAVIGFKVLVYFFRAGGGN